MSTPLPRRLRGRLALLSVAGALMVALPLGQVLRYQGAEIQLLAAQRAGLDPVGRTVDVQRSLLAHRDLATRVLRGQAAAEPERRVRQGEVDDRLGALALALSAGLWERAVREADALREDWLTLARQCSGRSLAVAESELAHRLLIEQTLQVLDLLADATPAAGQARAAPQGDPSTALWAATLALPRLAAGWDQPDLPAREQAAQHARLLRTLAAMHSLLDQPAQGSAEDRSAWALARTATAAARAAAEQQFALAGGTAPATEWAATAQATQHAQYKAFKAVAEALALRLETRQAAAEVQRSTLLVVLVALGLLSLALLAQLSRGLKRLGGARPARSVGNGPGDGADDGDERAVPRNPGREETGRLLQRLRVGDESARSDSPATDFQPTLPPR